MERPAPNRVAWTIDAALAAFAATAGALLVFGRARGGAFAAFEAVGRRVARELALPAWGDAALGMAVHLGQCVALGAATALLLGQGRAGTRLRAALLVVLAWELASRLPLIALTRAEIAAGIGVAQRISVALLLVLALAFAPRWMKNA